MDEKTICKLFVKKGTFISQCVLCMYQGHVAAASLRKKRVYMQLKVVIWWPWGSKGEVKSYLCRTNEGSTALPYPTYLYSVTAEQNDFFFHYEWCGARRRALYDAGSQQLTRDECGKGPPVSAGDILIWLDFCMQHFWQQRSWTSRGIKLKNK